MIELDAKGLSCPEPLMMAADAIKNNPGETIQIQVDTAAPRDNIMRLAKSRKRGADVVESAGVFTITIS